ncbi:hypothetical protein [Suttonella ornithocola]|uniref:Zn-ribbon-containing, possibly RNA-binding protein and truncated derivatives n=1 Tax=Suttonella ornithocola TaxID=279832 RepID=A0A380MN37_9GAMM|nr:hypothetical protein [Suttonella ornithocola]SUO93313.1 Uncharacterised protein [Suttonella ornithocola]
MPSSSNVFQTPEQLAEKIFLRCVGEKPEFQLHQRYQSILMHHLPKSWRHRVLFQNVSNGIWTLSVADNAQAFQLRFMLPEISQALAEHLPNPPKLKVQANPALWKHLPKPSVTPNSIHAREISQEKALATIDECLNYFKMR